MQTFRRVTNYAGGLELERSTAATAVAAAASIPTISDTRPVSPFYLLVAPIVLVI